MNEGKCSSLKSSDSQAYLCGKCVEDRSLMSSTFSGQKHSGVADEQRQKGDLCGSRTGSCTWGRRCLLLKVIKTGQRFTFANMRHGYFANPE